MQAIEALSRMFPVVGFVPNSDKVYHAAIEPKGEGYLVTFAYGRRGKALIHDHRQMIRAFCFDRRRKRS